MTAKPPTRTPPPLWPDRRHAVAGPPAWNQPTQPLRRTSRRASQWSTYGIFGGIILLVGCLAILVTLLAR